jgi:hypothetical protein
MSPEVGFLGACENDIKVLKIDKNKNNVILFIK